MRLVDICEFFSDFGGGVRTYVHQKLEACANEGWEATIIAPGPADRREKRLGGEIIWVRSPTLAFDHRYHLFARSKPVHDLLDELNPTVIEGSSTWRGGWIAAKWRGDAAKILFLHQDPVAVYPHSLLSPAISEDMVDKLFLPFWAYLRRLARQFDATAVAGEWFAQRLERFGVASPMVTPLGVDKTLFSHHLRSSTARAEMLAACGVDDPEAPLFIAVSRHHPEKRLRAMMEAFDRFRSERPAGLYLIGDGPDWRTVRRDAASRPNIHVAGLISDRQLLAKRLASADYMIHGGAAETFGLVVGEALCSGLPIVTPHIGGAADLAHPAYAETYRAGDPDAFADALRRIVARDRPSLAIAARAGAHRLVSPAQHFEALLAQYARLAEDLALARAA